VLGELAREENSAPLYLWSHGETSEARCPMPDVYASALKDSCSVLSS
jgi:hypothetical protein